MESIIFVDGKPAAGNVINAEGTAVEIKANTNNVTVLFPRKVVVGANDGNLTIFGEHAEIEVETNSSNLSIFGDFHNINIGSNNCNLHIYGDHSTVTVRDNDSNLHILGLHNTVNVLKGKAVVYGYYGSVDVAEGARAETAGEYKEVRNSAGSPAEIQLVEGDVFDAKSYGADGLAVFYSGLSEIRADAAERKNDGKFNASFTLVRYIDTDAGKVENTEDMRQLLDALLGELAAAGCRTVAMNGIRVHTRPDMHTRPEKYQIEFIREWLAGHPGVFEKICLIDRRGGFNHADEKL